MSLDQLCVNTIRMLAVDAVEKAKSGHPGLPLGAAAMTYTLWQKFLHHNPKDPKWNNRDRFVLSAGHGCAMLYALLHLTGYDVSLDEIKNFRQWQSKTPGHPEYGETPGVEATTGPLGQGFAMGVGMAMAEKYLSGYFNRPGFSIVDHFTYAVVSDGDLMEGIAAEAASLAGHLSLGKLIYLYDDNKITIDGTTDITFSEDVAQRFLSYGWQVLKVTAGNDIEKIASAIAFAKNSEKPSLVIVRTHIGYGTPKQDTPKAHGEPLGADALAQARKNFDWPETSFYIPQEAQKHFHQALHQGNDLQQSWNQLFQEYQNKHPELAQEFTQAMAKEPLDFDIPQFEQDKQMATRSASGTLMNTIASKIFNFIGGSADLAGSNKTLLKDKGNFSTTENGRNIHFGIREHAMAAIVNGMAVHGGVVPYGATFLTFSDYMRPALRLASLMKVSSIFIFSHDSIGLGEDGPTHQPVEHLMSLRTIPGFCLLRPADANETAQSWHIALNRKGPVALVLTRQNLPVLEAKVTENTKHGAYILSESADPQVILIATGSEVHLALSAKKELESKDIRTRVVSMPSWEIFEEQGQEYCQKVLPAEIPKVAIEAGVTLGWQRFTGTNGAIVGIDRFGASAPWQIVYEKLGFNVENVVKKALALVK